jgi:sirohydrochlorin cobaltochelatase
MTAVVVLAHGSERSITSCLPALALVEALRGTGRVAQARAAFWKQDPALSRALEAIDEDEVYLLPFFFAEGYFTGQVIPRELGLAQAPPGVRLCAPLGLDPRLVEVALARVAEAAPGLVEAEAALVLVGHGSARSARSRASTLSLAARLRALGRFAEVEAVFTDDEPPVREALGLVKAARVVVVPALASDGYHARETIPADLGLATDPDPGPHAVGGREIYLSRALGSSPRMLEVALSAVEAARGGPLPAAEAERPLRGAAALLGALDGEGRALGEVLARALGPDGWELRHVADRGQEGLAVLAQEALAAWALRGEGGALRAARGGPGLARGWRARGRGAAALGRALDALCPEIFGGL